MTEHEKKVMLLASQAAIYVPANSEGIRISYCDPNEKCDDCQGVIYGQGEDSGRQYQISFAKVNLKEDIFYKLVAMN